MALCYAHDMDMDRLIVEVAEALVKCAYATDENKTLHLREVANRLVDMRELCEDPFNRGADYTGRSKPYRDAVSEAYRRVEDEVPPARLRQMKSQVRYHVSSIVRERLANSGDPFALELYGLQPKSVKDRSLDRMKQRRALVDAGVMDDDDSNVTARLIHGARYLVDLAVEEGTAEANQEAKDYIHQGLRQVVESLPSLTSPADRLEFAENLLDSVPAESIRHLSEPVRLRVDESLTKALEKGHELRRETTTGSGTITEMDALLDRYREEPRGAKRIG